MKICIFGAASNEINKAYIDAVEVLGEEMAKRGHTLVFGAGANGLMGAAARGVKRCGGDIIGVIPHFFREEYVEEIYQECTELIYTDTMAERITKMRDLADAFITVPGGIGTFEEFFEVLTLKQLARHNKAMALLDINNYYVALNAFLETSVKERFLREECKDLFLYSDSIEEVLTYLENDKRDIKDVHQLKNG